MARMKGPKKTNRYRIARIRRAGDRDRAGFQDVAGKKLDFCHLCRTPAMFQFLQMLFEGCRCLTHGGFVSEHG